MRNRLKIGKVAITPRGEYDPEKKYERLDAVLYNGDSYLVLKEVSGVAPVEGEFFAVLAVGSAGPKGDQGEKGDTGEAGPKGDAGERGPKGDQGDGLKIVDYVATAGQLPASAEIGLAYGVGAEAPYEIYIYGNSGWVNNGKLQGPQGEKGEKGETGEAGPKGDKGDQGVPGVDGAAGPQGIQGEQGPKGDKGDPATVNGKTGANITLTANDVGAVACTVPITMSITESGGLRITYDDGN